MRTRLLPAAILFAITVGLWAANGEGLPGKATNGKGKDAPPVVLTAEEQAKLPVSLQQQRGDPAVEKYRQAILVGWRAGSLTDGEAASLASKLRRFERAAKGAKRGSKPSKRGQVRMQEAMRVLEEAIAKQTGDRSVREVALAPGLTK